MVTTEIKINEIKKLTHKVLKNDRIKLLKVEQKLKKETRNIIVFVSILLKSNVFHINLPLFMTF